MPRFAIPRKVLAAFVTLFFVTLGGGLPPINLAPVPAGSVDSISATELRMHLEFLASRELGGRYTLAPNFAVAARYLAAHLSAYGFHGAGDHGDFLQHFIVVSSRPDPEKNLLAINLNGRSENYKFGDFYPLDSGEGTVEGKIVFAAGGISSPSGKEDDYANLDVKGKIVLVVLGISDSADQGEASVERTAAAHGAVAVLEIPPPRLAEVMRRKGYKDRAAARERIRLGSEDEHTVPAVFLTPELAEKLVTSLGLRWDDIQDAQNNGKRLKPKATDASASLTVALRQQKTITQNVAAILPGTDPVLKNEYIVFSAHYDHLETDQNGQIYPGADDDGSGTTSVLTIAHAMALDPPKRSVLVMFHAGEELGLLGSEYNTDYSPAVPLGQIVADLNIDMIGRSKPSGDHDRLDERLTDANTIYLVGADRISKELNKISEETNSEYEKLKLDYYYNDASNPDRIYYRSDHWNYAKHGIPVIFYFDGTHVDYHRPTDTIDKIDFEKMTRVARLVFETGWRLANLDHALAKEGRR